MRDDRARADERVSPNRQPCHDDRPGASVARSTMVFSKPPPPSVAVLGLLHSRRSGVDVVRKGDARADESAVLDRDSSQIAVRF